MGEPITRKRATQRRAIDYQKGLLVLAVEILLKKRKDYSGADDPYANLRVAEGHSVHPIVGTNIRCNDKLVRVSNIVAAGMVKDGGLVGEKVIDDLRDVINYASISAGLLAEEDPETDKLLMAAALRFEEVMLEFSAGSELGEEL